MTKQAFIEKEIINILSDNKLHPIAEIRESVSQKYKSISKDCTLIRATLHKLQKDSIILRVQRGIYASIDYDPNKPVTEFNSDNFITLKPVVNKYSLLAVNILQNGHINLNGKLNQLIHTRKITVQFSDNYKKIRLIPDGNSPHIFTKSGTSTNINLIQQLKKHRISLPAKYIIECDDNTSYFIGNYASAISKK